MAIKTCTIKNRVPSEYMLVQKSKKTYRTLYPGAIYHTQHPGAIYYTLYFGAIYHTQHPGAIYQRILSQTLWTQLSVLTF